MWPNCGFNISIQECEWISQSLLENNASVNDQKWLITTNSFELQLWWCHQNMQSGYITWLIVATQCQCQDVYVLDIVQIESYICATRHAFIPFCSTQHGTLTIRAPLNWDQLCGHIYAHLAWPNYSNHCCRQQIKVSCRCAKVPRKPVQEISNTHVFHFITTKIILKHTRVFNFLHHKNHSKTHTCIQFP